VAKPALNGGNAAGMFEGAERCTEDDPTAGQESNQQIPRNGGGQNTVKRSCPEANRPTPAVSR
jgi:hypothetical protein